MSKQPLILAIALSAGILIPTRAAPRKHTVVLGATKRVPYSKAGDPAGASADETVLRIRPLVVDDVVKDWTTGDAHDVTDRSFVVRRVIRLNDALPEDKTGRWIWQRGPWLLVDRISRHIRRSSCRTMIPA